MGFGTAYDGERLRHVSASQLASFEACPAKWHAEKILKRPSFQDWSWANQGSAVHQILEGQVNASIGKETPVGRVYDAALMEEAEEIVARFSWESYFLDHEITGAEIDMVYPLEINGETIDLVGSVDVASFDSDLTPIATDWKTGYGADKGVDIQSQIYGLMMIRNYESDQSIFRRIYPRLPGEERGVKKVEEYRFNREDVDRFEERIKHTVSKMLKVVSGDMNPSCSPGIHCINCGYAHSCPVAKDEAFTPAQLVDKLRVIEAAKKQGETALKKVADEGNFFVGDEEWGYSISESYRLPKELKKEQIPSLLALHNPQLLQDKADIKIDDAIKTFLEGMGVEGIKNQARKTFKLLNEDELKASSKTARKSETTLADTKKTS